MDEALRQLPQHDYIYLADSANAPYGEKSSEWIAARSLILCKYLASKGCDAIVVACNTATAEAIAQIRTELSIPIIGVEPGIKPAAMQSQNGIVGVLATEATLKSDKFNALLATLPDHCTHYPFLRKSIRKLLGDTITLIDTSDAVVKQLKRQLETLEHNSHSEKHGSITLISSKNEASLLVMAKDLLSSDLNLHLVHSALLGDVL